MDPLVLRAWGDESMRAVHIDSPSYLLGAVVADPAACTAFRDDLERLPRRGPKLHWRDQDARSRRAAIAAIAGFDAHHVVVTAAPVEQRRQERARALCLERLAWELDEYGVQLLTLEARPTQLMLRDLRTIDGLRSKRAISRQLRVEHELPSAEPMLWVADQVLGALGEAMAGGNTAYFDAVRAATVVHHIDL